jgi:hypothetical protein
VFPTKKGATEFYNSSERRPNMKQSTVACLSDNPYFSSFGKASVDNPIVTLEKILRSLATETFFNSISAGASVTKLSAFEGTPKQKGFLQKITKTATCAENKLIVYTFPYKGSAASEKESTCILHVITCT